MHKVVEEVEKRRFSFTSVCSNKPIMKGESVMKLEVTVSEIVDMTPKYVPSSKGQQVQFGLTHNFLGNDCFCNNTPLPRG